MKLAGLTADPMGEASQAQFAGVNVDPKLGLTGVIRCIANV